MTRFPVARVFGATFPVAIHPAPETGQHHEIAVTAAASTIWTAAEDSQFVLVEVTAPVRMLAGAVDAVGGKVLRPGRDYSFGIEPGSEIAFRAVDEDATVEISEA